MQFFKYVLVGALCMMLVVPTDAASWISKAWKKVKKTGCRLLFGIGCPFAVNAAAGYVSDNTRIPSGIIAHGRDLGSNFCHVRKNKCKRSVASGEILLPFSDEFTDYDRNGDKLITLEEFLYAVMFSVRMADAEELAEPFLLADSDGDEILTTDEFKFAPWLFGHEDNPMNGTARMFG